MACPTCDHTMECIYLKEGEAAFWCPRCGTVKSPWLTSPAGEAPKLVERCREFEKKNVGPAELGGTADAPWVGNDWRTLGIAESINKPEARPCA